MKDIILQAWVDLALVEVPHVLVVREEVVKVVCTMLEAGVVVEVVVEVVVIVKVIIINIILVVRVEVAVMLVQVTKASNKDHTHKQPQKATKQNMQAFFKR